MEVQIPQRRKTPLVIDADEGIRPAVLEQIAALPPASPDGLHTFATQTHPADGCAGAVVTTVQQARELANGDGVVQILATGFARVRASRMPEAPVPAAMAALDAAGIGIGQRGPRA